jgi:tetratricopeptide (TPR) repeat protein
MNPELAEHFSYSSDNADLAKAISYGEMAAKRAMGVYAYSEAARLLEQAIRVQEVMAPEDKTKRCDLLLTICEDLNYATECRRVINVEAPAALALAESTNDIDRVARACTLAILALFSYGSGSVAATPEYALWVEKINRYARPDTVAKAWAMYSTGYMKYTTGDYNGASPIVKEAIGLVRKLGNWDAFARSSHVLYSFGGSQPEDAQKMLKVTEEIMTSPARYSPTGRGLSLVIHTYLSLGERSRVEEVIREHNEFAGRRRQADLQLWSMRYDTLLLGLDGRLEEAVEAGKAIFARGQETDMPMAATTYCLMSSMLPFLYLGRPDDHLPGEEYRVSAGSFANNALMLAYEEKNAEVVGLIEEHLLARKPDGSPAKTYSFFLDVMWLAAATIVGHYPAVEYLMSRILNTRMLTTGTQFAICVPLHLGNAYAFLASTMKPASITRKLLR